MCIIIIINRGQKEIGTPIEFVKHFGFAPCKFSNESENDNIDNCLCDCNIEKVLKEHKIQFKKSFGDIFVGMLEDVVGDDD